MNTSASTRSGRTSAILRTAASPFPTATTSMPCSFRARPTIFWMLLLSSATRIFGTKRPPPILHPCKPLRLHCSTKGFRSSFYWSIRGRARQSPWGRIVSQNNTAHLYTATPARPCENSKSCGLLGRTCRNSKPVPLGKRGLPRHDFLQSLFFLAARLFFAAFLGRPTSRLVPGRLCRVCLGAAVVGLAIRGSRPIGFCRGVGGSSGVAGSFSLRRIATPRRRWRLRWIARRRRRRRIRLLRLRFRLASLRRRRHVLCAAGRLRRCPRLYCRYDSCPGPARPRLTSAGKNVHSFVILGLRCHCWRSRLRGRVQFLPRTCVHQRQRFQDHRVMFPLRIFLRRHPRHRLRVRLRHRRLQRLQLLRRRWNQRRKRIFPHDSCVIGRRQFLLLRAFPNISQHPQRVICLA